jgi:hypothetical protein
VPAVRVNGVVIERLRSILECVTGFAGLADFARAGAFFCCVPDDMKLDRWDRRSRRVRAVSPTDGVVETTLEIVLETAVPIFPVFWLDVRLGRREVVICGTSVPFDRVRICARVPD